MQEPCNQAYRRNMRQREQQRGVLRARQRSEDVFHQPRSTPGQAQNACERSRTYVKNDGIHAENDERSRPGAPTLHIDQPEPHAQDHTREPGHEYAIGTGPDVLVDGQKVIHGRAQAHQERASRKEPSRLPLERRL